MKLYKALFFIITFIWLTAIMMALSSCTETIYEEIFTTDTVWLTKPSQGLAPTFITVTDTVHTVDTVKVEVIVKDTDTVFQYITKDSIVIKEIEKVVNHYDTIVVTKTDTITIVKHDTVILTVYDRTVVYADTFWIVDPFNMVTFFPNEVAPYIQEFHQSCQDRGIFINGRPLLVQYSDNLPGENWSSFSYIVGFQQMIIEISDKLPAEQQRAGILRELNRLQRNKKYTTIDDRIMNPLFPPDRTITAAHLNELYK